MCNTLLNSYYERAVAVHVFVVVFYRLRSGKQEGWIVFFQGHAFF